MQPIAKDPLVAHERVLSAGLLVVARFPLLSPTTDLANTVDNPISRTTSTASGLRGLDRRHNDLRASNDGGVIQGTAIVGPVANFLADLAWRAIHKLNAHAGVIYVRICQHLADDYAIAVDTEVQLRPTTNALAAVFSRSPLAFAEDGKPAAVDDQIYPAKLLRHP